ncbi:MAG: protein adenylyltransferase SelO [Verrucomicrobiales bacterium]
MDIAFDNSYTKLPENFFARQSPSQVPDPQLIRLNQSLARQLGLDPSWLESADGVSMLAGNALPAGAEPIAQAYAGHQFGGFVPQLGDGRAVLLGELIDVDGQRRDVQLKGSGRTPFSRGGDGKSALGPVIREYILSEAMAALGVPTTRALAALSTGEAVLRQEGMLAGGIFTRVAASHIRVGTFQYFFARNDLDAIRALADYTIERHYPQASDAPAPYVELLKSVAVRQAELIAQWMSVGFIHGVMNTDNTAVSGETIDYGPCAFMESFHPQCVFSSIDRGARYAWANQPDIALWNLARFAETLCPLLSDDPGEATEIAKASLAEFPQHFARRYDQRFRAKFGLPPSAPEEIIADGLSLLAEQQVDFTLFFRRLTQVAAGEGLDKLSAMFSAPAPFQSWFKEWENATGGGATREDEMRRANPILIPRNHRVEQAIQAAYKGDYSPFHRLCDALATPFEEPTKNADLESPARPEEVVHETFCGT